jgi:hypothetical protein
MFLKEFPLYPAEKREAGACQTDLFEQERAGFGRTDESPGHSFARSTGKRARGLRGTIITVSHDRYFLDKVSTQILAFEDDRSPEIFDGNYSEYHDEKEKRDANMRKSENGKGEIIYQASRFPMQKPKLKKWLVGSLEQKPAPADREPDKGKSKRKFRHLKNN